jgi:ribosomal-protein-alanine N-acetyltransferase
VNLLQLTRTVHSFVKCLLAFLDYSRLLDEANIDNVAVSPHYQGRGFGRALLLTALDNMCAIGLKRCMLEVRESNVAAKALYENNGFVIDGVRPQYYKTQQGREDALLMSRRL